MITNKQPIQIILAAVIFSGCYLPINHRTEDTTAITVPELYDHIAFLASDSLKGRKPGTKEGKIAAEYIAEELAQLGLLPMGDDGFQYFEVVTSISQGENNSIVFSNETFRLNEDYVPLAFSSNSSLSAEIAFAGYGFDFTTDSITWESYADIDVTDKWVIILRGEPGEDEAFDQHNSLLKKVMVAKDNGAGGVLFISGENFDMEDELIPLIHNPGQADAGLSIVQIKRPVADKILKSSGKNIAELEKTLSETQKPYSFLLSEKIAICTSVKKKEVTTQNVIGMLPGADPILKNEIIILGAHYDHLGFGGPHSGSRKPDTVAVHNGADDNASGVAAILEIIEKIAQRNQPLKRSVLFMSFGAEEMGLIGSKYFTKNPLIDLNDIHLMLNLDMVGRLNQETKALTIGGTGTANGLSDKITALAQGHDIVAKTSPGGMGPSDHASFYIEDVPVLFFFTGVHEDYHTPADDTEKINFEGEKSVADFVSDVLVGFANQDDKLVYTEAGPKSRPSGRRRFKVTLGIMPDVASTEANGLRVDGVVPNRPADFAGMKKGDVIIAMDGKSVNGIYEYMHRLADFKPGQRITVTVQRGEENIALIVEL